MRLVSRSGLIAIALAVTAMAASTAQASSLAGISNAPASTAPIVVPIPNEQVTGSSHSGPPPPAGATSSRDGVGEPRLRAFFAQLAGTHAKADRLPVSARAHASTDRLAAERAAASPSAPLVRFSLINVHTTTTADVSGNPDSGGFHVGDAAIGAGVMAGLLVLGVAGGLAARRRRRPLHT